MSNIRIIPIRTPLQVVFMCKASLIVNVDEERFHITRRVFNEIQCGVYTDSVIIVERPDKTGNMLKWLAIPTIF